MSETFEPVVIEVTGKEHEKVHLFSIVEDGETKEYFIPKEAPYNLTLAALKVAANAGPLAAQIFAMEELLGEEGFNALLDCDELTEAQFDAIADHINKLTMGESKGKLNRASRRAQMRSRGSNG